MLAKDELGKDAIVMNIKTIAPKGIYKLFKKKTVEVTAAVDEAAPIQEKVVQEKESLKNMKKNANIIYEESDLIQKGVEAAVYLPSGNASAIEKKLNNLTSLLEKQMNEKENEMVQEGVVKETAVKNNNIACIQLIYNQLVENEVDEKFVNQIIAEIEPTLKKDATVDNILSSIYQKIVLKLGRTETLEISKDTTKFIFFVGPTGVGKTTTIAKIASSLKINRKANVALLAADTYRIAAVEQLQTYANILGIPLHVLYSEHEMETLKERLGEFDLVLVDTAGRSHKNRQQQNDIEQLLLTIPKKERETYLVLSAATKYSDLKRITEVYSEITDYKLIFTKLDETNCIGNIFNIKMLTDAPLSYATFGQSVPEDISRIDAQTIAKQLLGGND